MFLFKHLASLGGDYTYARAINNEGQIVGDSYLSGNTQQRAFLSQKDTIQNIGQIINEHASVTQQSVANGINSRGMIIGHSFNKKTAYNKKIYNAFLFQTDDNHALDLGTLGGTSSFAFDVNDKGQIVGQAHTAEEAEHAYLYNSKDTPASMQDLGTLGGLHSTANAINNAGQIAGHSLINVTDTHAFLYDENIMHDIGTLGGSSSFAYGINDYGQVVGSSYDQDGNDHAFLYDRIKRPCMKDLGTLGGSVSVANDINNACQIVGYSFLEDNADAHAFLYHDQDMINLNHVLDTETIEAGWILNEAIAINDQGWIVGTAYNNKLGCPSCAFLLTVDTKTSRSYVKFLKGLGFDTRFKKTPKSK